jgi:site-specific recombinase XerC
MASLRKRGKNWYYRYSNEDGVKVERKGCSDKKVTEGLAREAESQVARIKAGDVKSLRVAEANRQPIQRHVDDFLESLRQARRKPKHINNTKACLNRMLCYAAIERLSDFTPSAFLSALAKLKDEGFAARTIEAHVIAVKSLARWLWKDGRTSDYSLLGLTKPKGGLEGRKVRRPLSESELRSLIDSTKTAPSWRGLSGEDRSILYAVAATTGFRRAELKSLTVDSFRLDSKPPTIVCEAGYTKNGQLAEQPIPESLANVLRSWLGTKPPGRPVFDQITNWTAMMLRFDLARCGIPFKDESGREVVFHSLRHSYITALVKTGTSVKMLQTLARHHDPKLTLNIYSHLTLFDTSQAVEALPDLCGPSDQCEALAMTGTDRIAHLLPTEGDATCRISSDSGGRAICRKSFGDMEGSAVRAKNVDKRQQQDSRKNDPTPITDLVLLVHS